LAISPTGVFVLHSNQKLEPSLIYMGINTVKRKKRTNTNVCPFY
jgi:hypothetical protein